MRNDAPPVARYGVAPKWPAQQTLEIRWLLNNRWKFNFVLIPRRHRWPIIKNLRLFRQVTKRAGKNLKLILLLTSEQASTKILIWYSINNGSSGKLLNIQLVCWMK